jgi:hypothetical protein
MLLGEALSLSSAFNSECNICSRALANAGRLTSTSGNSAPYANASLREANVSAENWHEERDRLVQLLEGIDSGRITHVDEDDMRQLQATNLENVALLKERLATLNARLSNDDC